MPRFPHAAPLAIREERIMNGWLDDVRDRIDLTPVTPLNLVQETGLADSTITAGPATLRDVRLAVRD